MKDSDTVGLNLFTNAQISGMRDSPQSLKMEVLELTLETLTSTVEHTECMRLSSIQVNQSMLRASNVPGLTRGRR